MKKNQLKFIVIFDKTFYEFDYGSQVYIFHTGIFNGIRERYGKESLLDYVNFVHSVYLKDTERTNLGKLCDFIASRWDEYKHELPPRREVLDSFYECC